MFDFPKMFQSFSIDFHQKNTHSATRHARCRGDRVADFRAAALLGWQLVKSFRRRQETLEGGLAFVQQPAAGDEEGVVTKFCDENIVRICDNIWLCEKMYMSQSYLYGNRICVKRIIICDKKRIVIVIIVMLEIIDSISYGPLLVISTELTPLRECIIHDNPTETTSYNW